MSEMIGDIVQGRAELAERLVEAEAEIAELRAQLAAKSAQEEGLATKLEGHGYWCAGGIQQKKLVEAWREANAKAEAVIATRRDISLHEIEAFNAAVDEHELALAKARALDAEALKAGQS